MAGAAQSIEHVIIHRILYGVLGVFHEFPTVPSFFLFHLVGVGLLIIEIDY